MHWQGRTLMRRREFVRLLSGAAAVAPAYWPLAAHAQQAATPVIGFLSVGTSESNHDYVAAFHRGLADGGFAEGRNVGIEYRWSEGHNDRLPALAEDLVRDQVTAIAVNGTGRFAGCQSGDSDNPDRFLYWYRPSWTWSRREPRAPRRQYHRRYQLERRAIQKML
jgi:hypothetical protein